MSIVGAAEAVRLEQLSDSEVCESALAALESMLPARGADAARDACRACTGCVRSGWGAHKFTRGAFSHLPPGTTPAHYDTLACPEFGGALCFAGEHTSSEYPNTMHGALLSGAREAQRVLRAVPGVVVDD